MIILNKRRFIKRVIIISILLSQIFIKFAFADVGDFQTYDESSSWYDGASVGSSSSDGEFLTGDGSEDVVGGGIAYLLVIITRIFTLGSDKDVNTLPIVIVILTIFTVFFAIRIIKDKFKKKEVPYIEKEQEEIEVDEYKIEDKIKVIDPDFNRIEMLTWAYNLYEKLQEAWTNRDWSSIRFYESNELYSQHYNQLQRYKENKQINKIENLDINWIKLYDFTQIGDKDVLTIVLNSTMIDYIINEETEEILQGDMYTKRTNTFKLTFVRKTGTKSKQGEIEVNTTNCPNCGAPTEIGTSGECPYCKTIITTGDFNWVLLNLEPFKK